MIKNVLFLLKTSSHNPKHIQFHSNNITSINICTNSIQIKHVDTRLILFDSRPVCFDNISNRSSTDGTVTSATSPSFGSTSIAHAHVSTSVQNRVDL